MRLSLLATTVAFVSCLALGGCAAGVSPEGDDAADNSAAITVAGSFDEVDNEAMAESRGSLVGSKIDDRMTDDSLGPNAGEAIAAGTSLKDNTIGALDLAQPESLVDRGVVKSPIELITPTPKAGDADYGVFGRKPRTMADDD